MLLTDKVRKQMSDYMFDTGVKVKEFYRDMDDPEVSYETLRLFYNGSTTANGHTINEIDRYLQSKGYGVGNDS